MARDWTVRKGYRVLDQRSAFFRKTNYHAYGLSIQSPIVQKEFVQRNHIPFPILSDEQHELTDQLKLPTFMFEGERLIKRMAFVIAKGKIEKVFYPVFPPDKNADEVLNWIKSSQESTLLKLPSPTTNCD